MIVSIASRKASPGVTTLTTMLAASWPTEVNRLILEADPSGGTLAARWSPAHEISWDPGLVAMASARGLDNEETVFSMTQGLTGALRIAAAPPSPAQVSAALSSMGEQAAADLAGLDDVHVFADLGRLTSASPAMPIARRSALVVLMCRPNLEEVHSLMSGAAELVEAGCTLGLVTVGSGPYHSTEIADNAGIDLLGHLPTDNRAASAWASDGLAAGRAFRRSSLLRAVSDLAILIESRCAQILVPDVVLAGRTDTEAEPVESRPAAEPIGLANAIRSERSGAVEHNGTSRSGASRTGTSRNGATVGGDQ